MLDLLDRRLIGTWLYTGPDKERPFGECYLVFTSSHYWLFYEIQETDKHGYLVDTNQSPHQIDIPGPPSVKGLYSIDGNELKFCLGNDNDDRPDRLTDNADNGWVCEIYVKLSDTPKPRRE